MDPGNGGEPSDGLPADAESAASQLGRALDDLAHRFDQRDWVELAHDDGLIVRASRY